MPADPLALEFARFVVQRHPGADFPALYDALCRAATMRSFRGLGRQELAEAGVSFSLLATDDLAALIKEARTALLLGGSPLQSP
jgi:hypothetical protein